MNTADPLIIEKFKNLPQKLRDILFAEDTTDTIFAIGKENNLTVFQMEELADEAGLVILGITAVNDFAKNIGKKLSLDAQKSAPIAKSINEKIFNPILSDLKVEVKPEISVAPVPSNLPTEKPAKNIVATPPQKPPEILSVQKPVPQPPKPVIATSPTPTQSVPIVPAKDNSSFLLLGKEESVRNSGREVVNENTLTTPKPLPASPVSPTGGPAGGLVKEGKQEVRAEQIFAKPIQDPYREPINDIKIDSAKIIPSPTQGEQSIKPKITNWGDILKNIKKEPESHPDAKSALEKAMSDLPAQGGPAVPLSSPEPTAQKASQLSGSAKYTGGKDPYREPLD